jgi:CRISPR-associated protein Csm2
MIMSANTAAGPPGRPIPGCLPRAYVDLVRSGYFDRDGVIREQYLRGITQDLVRRFQPGQQTGLTSSQLRNFYNNLKTAQTAYKNAVSSQEGDRRTAGQVLLRRVQTMESLIYYAKGKEDNTAIPDAFLHFILENVNACKTPKDVNEGFFPHFQAVLGFFKYYEQEQAQRYRSSNPRR